MSAYRLLVAYEVFEFLERLPAKDRKMLRNSFLEINGCQRSDPDPFYTESMIMLSALRNRVGVLFLGWPQGLSHGLTRGASWMLKTNAEAMAT